MGKLNRIWNIIIKIFYFVAGFLLGIIGLSVILKKDKLKGNTNDFRVINKDYISVQRKNKGWTNVKIPKTVNNYDIEKVQLQPGNIVNIKVVKNEKNSSNHINNDFGNNQPARAEFNRRKKK